MLWTIRNKARRGLITPSAGQMTRSQLALTSARGQLATIVECHPLVELKRVGQVIVGDRPRFG
jgi:hypothetical protein